MDLTFNEEEAAFRDELRAWLAENPPGSPPDEEGGRFRWALDWQRRLHEGGWAGVSWPVSRRALRRDLVRFRFRASDSSPGSASQYLDEEPARLRRATLRDAS